MALNGINLLKVSMDLPEQDLNLFEVNSGWFQMWLISRKMETTEISRNILTQDKLLVEFIGTRNSNQEHINKKSLVNLRLLVISIVKNLFLGNKAKEQISKRVFQENKARQIFRKNKHSYPLIRTLPYYQRIALLDSFRD